MFLIRTVFWLSIVIILIPADQQSNTPAPGVSMLEALSSARTAAADFSGFCDRNPDVCATSAAAFQVFAEKAQHGARMLFRYFDEAAGSDGSADEPEGTLIESDRAPTWQGPKQPDAV